MNYFDYAASCPLDRDAAEIYIRASTEFYGNSQSLHDVGSAASNLLESCRDEISGLLGVNRTGVFFTGGGSEANLLGIMALLSAVRKPGRHIITGAAEHSSVFNMMKKLENEGWQVTYLPMNRKGQYELDSLKAAVTPETVLLSLHHANPEIGTLQPIKDFAAFCRANHILFHSDCVQTFGKIPLEDIATAVDALSISGHKFYGPKGTGAAYINPVIPWKPFISGTTHERGFRPGTVNVPGIAAMTAAAQKIHISLPTETTRQGMLRDLLLSTITALTDKMAIFGTEGNGQLPGIMGMGIKGVEGQYVLLEANRNGLAISTGTACHVGMEAPAKSMTAMGIGGKDAKEFFRISFGLETTREEVQKLGTFLAKLAIQLSEN